MGISEEAVLVAGQYRRCEAARQLCLISGHGRESLLIFGKQELSPPDGHFRVATELDNH